MYPFQLFPCRTFSFSCPSPSSVISRTPSNHLSLVLPLPHSPYPMPIIIAFTRPSDLIMWSKYLNFCLSISLTSRGSIPSSVRIDLLLHFSIHEILNIYYLLQHQYSLACNLSLSFFIDSPWFTTIFKTGNTSVLTSITFFVIYIPLSFHILIKHIMAALPKAILLPIYFLQPHVLSIIDPRKLKLLTNSTIVPSKWKNLYL